MESRTINIKFMFLCDRLGNDKRVIELAIMVGTKEESSGYYYNSVIFIRQ